MTMTTKFKACMIDISRFRVPHLDRMKVILERISKIGYNQVFFNIEHTFKIPEFPIIGKEADGYTYLEFKELNNYAETLGLDLIPIFQSFGHMFHILKWSEFFKYSESDGRWSVSISDEVYEFLDIFYKQISEAFTSEYIHVGGDEVYDLATDKSKHLLSDKTKDEIFLDHIFKLKDIASKYGKKVVVWGDMIEKNPEVLEKLGQDAMVCYWHYGLNEMPEIYYKIADNVYSCPGIQTWKSFFPRIEIAKKNIGMKANEYNNGNLKGFIITDWGDAGHIHPISFTEKLFEMAYNIYDGKDNFKFSNKKGIENIIKLLDYIHSGSYLNPKVLRSGYPYVTKLLLHEYIFSGKGFNEQSDEQLQELISKSKELEKLVNNETFETEFEKDILLFARLTLILADKCKLHLNMRNEKDYFFLERGAEEFIIKLRHWQGEFIANWNKTSKPMGLFYHIHYFKQIEKDIIDELKLIKNNKKLEIKTIYGDIAYATLFSVGNIEGLNYLWNEFRL